MSGLTRLPIAAIVVIAGLGCDDRGTDGPVTVAPAAQSAPADRATPSSYSAPQTGVDANPQRTTSAGSPTANPTTQPGRFTAPSATTAKNLPPSGGDATPPRDHGP